MWDIFFLDVSCRIVNDEWWRMCAQNYECGKFPWYTCIYITNPSMIYFVFCWNCVSFPISFASRPQKRDILWQLTTGRNKTAGFCKEVWQSRRVSAHAFKPSWLIHDWTLHKPQVKVFQVFSWWGPKFMSLHDKADYKSPASLPWAFPLPTSRHIPPQK